MDGRVDTMREKDEIVSERQAGFTPNRSCVDNVHMSR